LQQAQKGVEIMTFNQVALNLLGIASVISLMLLVFKALGKEFESVALLWIRVLKRIQSEIKKKRPKSKKLDKPTKF
jgi:hypothetical protein